MTARSDRTEALQLDDAPPAVLRAVATPEALEQAAPNAQPPGGATVIELPEAAASVAPAAVLAAEFGDLIAADVVERVVAAARHALERAHLPSTSEVVIRLARERLRARARVLTEAAQRSAAPRDSKPGYSTTARPAPARSGAGGRTVTESPPEDQRAPGAAGG